MDYRAGVCFLIERGGRFACARCGARYKRWQLAACAVTNRAKPAPPPCPHLGAASGESAEVVCVCCGGQRKTRLYEIHACQLFGECLPEYECTRDSKQAAAEWMEREGRTVELTVCRGCPRVRS